MWLLRNAGFRVCGVRQNLYVFSLYRNPDLDDRIFDSLVASMADVQAEDIRASFLFVGDLNGHRRSGWVLPPRTVMELQLLTLQKSPVAISWLSAQPMHVVEHLTSWRLMSLTLHGLMWRERNGIHWHLDSFLNFIMQNSNYARLSSIYFYVHLGDQLHPLILLTLFILIIYFSFSQYY